MIKKEDLERLNAYRSSSNWKMWRALDGINIFQEEGVLSNFSAHLQVDVPIERLFAYLRKSAFLELALGVKKVEILTRLNDTDSVMLMEYGGGVRLVLLNQLCIDYVHKCWISIWKPVRHERYPGANQKIKELNIMMVAHPLEEQSEIKVYYSAELDLGWRWRWNKRVAEIPGVVAEGIERLKILMEIQYAREGKNHRLEILAKQKERIKKKLEGVGEFKSVADLIAEQGGLESEGGALSAARERAITLSKRKTLKYSAEDRKKLEITSMVVEGGVQEDFDRMSPYTKWCKEKLLKEKHLLKLNEFIEALKSEGFQTDEAEAVRLIRARKYNVRKALELYKDLKAWREREKVSQLRVADFEPEYASGAVKAIGQDRHQRPLVYVRIRYYVPKRVDIERMQKYCIFSIEQAISRMPYYVDQYLVIFDFKGAKSENVNISQAKKLMPIFSNYYPDRLGAMFVVNPNLIMKIGWTTFKPFLDKVTIEKIHFLNEKQQKSHMLKYIDEDNLATEYGGNLHLDES